MPLYEYKCNHCKKTEEKLESLNSQNTHDCTFCNKKMGMYRQLSSNSFILAGGGWMANGYEKNVGTKK